MVPLVLLAVIVHLLSFDRERFLLLSGLLAVGTRLGTPVRVIGAPALLTPRCLCPRLMACLPQDPPAGPLSEVSLVVGLPWSAARPHLDAPVVNLRPSPGLALPRRPLNLVWGWPFHATGLSSLVWLLDTPRQRRSSRGCLPHLVAPSPQIRPLPPLSLLRLMLPCSCSG